MPPYVDAVYLPSYPARKKMRPLFLRPVAAGFPSPADDYLEGRLDLFEDRGRERSSRLMRVLDRFNDHMGVGTIR